jgi:hypothetical protein
VFEVEVGYNGKAKGLQQILRERGLQATGNKTELVKRLMVTEDFQMQQNAVDELVLGRGHMTQLSPKCHAELAGNGIEYNLGCSKLNFRRNNTCEPTTLNKRVVDSVLIVPLSTTRKFAARARRYHYVYTDGHPQSQEETDRLQRMKKTHRAVLDTSTSFLRDEEFRVHAASLGDGGGPEQLPVDVVERMECD